MTELDDGIVTPIPIPEIANAMTTNQAPELGCKTAKRIMDEVMKVAPATALTRSPTRTATYPQSEHTARRSAVARYQ